MASSGSHLFTLRVWQEDLGDGQIEWRGQIKHVLSGETRYFRRCSELRAFVRECLPGWKMEGGGGKRRTEKRRTKE